LDSILAEAPPEWNSEGIEPHLRMVSGHAEDFAEEVRRRLA
jgi:hypothetical protein